MEAVAASNVWLRPVVVASLMVGVSLATWIVALDQMRRMDAGPGTDLGSFGWYLGVWVTMMAAMMLPSTLPMVLLFDRFSRERSQRGRRAASTMLFVTGYLVAWTIYGIVAYALYRIIAGFHFGLFDWHREGPLFVGAAVVAAGLYELTPLKTACLRHCRAPMNYLLGSWKSGRLGAAAMGGTHGAYCVGCCFGLMLVLLALGLMSIFWMALVAALVFVQKVLPGGGRLARAYAGALVVLGCWVALAPSAVPQLSQPAGMPAMTPTGNPTPAAPRP